MSPAAPLHGPGGYARDGRRDDRFGALLDLSAFGGGYNLTSGVLSAGRTVLRHQRQRQAERHNATSLAGQTAR